MGTYETTKALESIHTQPDPIHWSTPHSYRSNPYRQLYHQKGIVGNVTIQLLQASDLKRSHWNALAIGPVKYLGLSSAHGPVSSYATFHLGFVSTSEAAAAAADDDDDGDISSTSSSTSSSRLVTEAAVAAGTASPMLPTPPMSSYSTSSTGRNMTSHSPSPLHYPYAGNDIDAMNNGYHYNSNRKHEREEIYRSSTIHRNDNPIWPTSTLSRENKNNDNNIKSTFVIPLRKGASSCDGKRIILYVQMNEERKVAECFVPSALRGSCIRKQQHERGHRKRRSEQRYHHHHYRQDEEEDACCIGKGCIDITGLVLGEDVPGWAGGRKETGSKKSLIHTTNAQKVGVWDIWVDLSLNGTYYASSVSSSSSTVEKKKDGKKKDCNNDSTGRVRVLISYNPNGLRPIRNDIVALESHTRRDILSSSCRPVLPPLEPFKVLDVRGSYLLVQYELPLSSNNNIGKMMAAPSSNSVSSSSNEWKKGKKKRPPSSTPLSQQQMPLSSSSATKKTGTIRLHRNAVFVIERTNIIDGAVDLALTPTDLLLSSPMGKAVADLTGPYVEAAGDLIMPAVLSAKLIFGATKTGVHASFIGVKAATESFVRATAQDPVDRVRSRKSRRRRSFSG